MIQLFFSAIFIGVIKGFMDWLGERIRNDRASISGPWSFGGLRR
jgi:hypothetical protein